MALLALALAHEALLGGSSRFAPYLTALPREGALSTSWLWAPAARVALLPPKHRADAEEIDSLAAHERAALLRASRRVAATAATEGGVAAAVTAALHGRAGRARWRWARACVYSRCFQMGGVIGLVPGCDAANHAEDKAFGIVDDYRRGGDSRPGAGTGTGRRAAGGSGAMLLCDRDICPGDEIFNSYGQHSNGDLLLQYGFVLPARAVDECEIMFDVASQDGDGAVERFEFLLPVGGPPDAGDEPKEWFRRWRWRRRRLLPKDVWESDGEYYDAWGVPRDLLRFARETAGACGEGSAGSGAAAWLEAFCGEVLADAERRALIATAYAEAGPLLGMEGEAEEAARHRQQCAISEVLLGAEAAALRRLRAALSTRRAAAAAAAGAQSRRPEGRTRPRLRLRRLRGSDPVPG